MIAGKLLLDRGIRRVIVYFANETFRHCLQKLAAQGTIWALLSVLGFPFGFGGM